MKKFGLSQPVERVEDERFLTGAGAYIDDVVPAGALHAVFLRSPVAHGTITALDVSAAKDAPGVHLVLTGQDLDGQIDHDMDGGTIGNRDGSTSARPRRPILAVDRVRHVGEAIAMVVADSRSEAMDALEMIELDIDTLPSVTDTAAALEPGKPQVHDEAAGNLCYDWSVGDEAKTEAALKGAVHTVVIDLVNNRVIANPMETRGCSANYENGKLWVHFNGQGVWDLKDEIARRFGMATENVQVVTKDVGGGFGTKSFTHPENLAVPQAARLLGRPVHWYADRTEGFQADVMGRDQITRVTAGFDADHKIVAMKTETLSNLGAYLSAAGVYIASDLASRVLTGVYDLQDAFFHVKGVFTHTTPVDAYRGAGRPEAQYALERMMDKAAREMGVDPVELRRKNFITPDKFPYTTVVNETYDVGDFNKVLDRTLVEADYAGFAERKAESARQRKLRGVGLCYYIESILGSHDETAKLVYAEDGMWEVLVGTQSNGQGHETVYAQFLNDRAGIPFDKIRIVQGDSDRIAKGGGTGGSRSVTMQGSAINAAADDLIEKMKPLAEEELEVSGADLVWEDGSWRVAGTDKAIDLMTLAAKAQATGRPEFLTQETDNTVPGRSFPNGCHVAEVEIDPETGVTQVVKYTVVDDFGVLMNPRLAEGQVHGGVAQGIGQALTEHVVYDEEGQLLSATFMDYAMPRAYDVPMIPFHHEGTPSTANAIGMKGCGEAGTVGALAAVMNAALDAVWDEGVHQVDMPMTPQRVWSWLQARQAIAAE